MPRKYRLKTRTRRRTRIRRRGIRKRAGLNTSSTSFANAPSKITIRGTSILPEILLTRLPYADLVQTSTVTTAPGIYTYRINSIFDPDKTGTGFFPTGYTELNNLYASYVCFGISYDIIAINMSDTVPARVCIVGTADDKTWATYQEAASQPYSSKSIVLGTLDGGNSVGRMKGYVSVANVHGVPPRVVSSDDLFHALFAGSPANTGFMQIVHGNLDGSSTTDVHYEISIKYFVRIFDLKPLTQTS